MDDYGGENDDQWGQDYGDEWGNYQQQEEQKVEDYHQIGGGATGDKGSKDESNLLAQFSNCPKSSDGKFMFITYNDVLKLFPIKIKQILEEYGLSEVFTEDQAIALLRLCKWNGERMSERWF